MSGKDDSQDVVSPTPYEQVDDDGHRENRDDLATLALGMFATFMAVIVVVLFVWGQK